MVTDPDTPPYCAPTPPLLCCHITLPTKQNQAASKPDQVATFPMFTCAFRACTHSPLRPLHIHLYIVIELTRR